jgi:hypothetical protein
MGAIESNNSNNFGFRIYHIYPESPLINKGIKELEDFILPPKGVDNLNFRDYLVKYQGKAIQLIIYNIPTRRFFPITVTLGKSGTLGSLVSYENYAYAHLNALKILKVNENSLSSKIGLKKDDYIIAIQPETEELISLNSQNCDPLTLFYNIIKTYSTKKIVLFVYNQSQQARKILTKCNSIYNYSLGCEVGYSKGNEIQLIDLGENLNFSNQEYIEKKKIEIEISKLEKDVDLKICQDESAENINNINSFTFSKSLAESLSINRKYLDNISYVEGDISPIKSLDNSNNLNIKSVSSMSSNSVD